MANYLTHMDREGMTGPCWCNRDPTVAITGGCWTAFKTGPGCISLKFSDPVPAAAPAQVIRHTMEDPKAS